MIEFNRSFIGTIVPDHSGEGEPMRFNATVLTNDNIYEARNVPFANVRNMLNNLSVEQILLAMIDDGKKYWMREEFEDQPEENDCD